MSSDLPDGSWPARCETPSPVSSTLLALSPKSARCREEEDDGDLFCLPVTELARVTALLLAIQSSKVGAQPREAAAASLLLAVSERRGGLLEILGNAGGVKTLLEVSAQGRKGKSAASYKSSPLLRCTAMEILEHLASDADICSHILAEGGLSALARLVDRWGGATADERAAAAAVLCCISAHPWCWRQMTSEGAVRSLVSALDTDR